MNFLVDMPLSPELAAWLRHEGHDAIHATEAGLACAADGEILDRAKREHRVIVTADLDYPRLLALAQLEEPAVVLFRGGNYSEREIRDRLKQVFSLVPKNDLQRSIVVVEKGRIRRRRLPLG